MEVLSSNSRDEHVNKEHLNLLSIFYFVFGGLSLLGAFILLIYTIIIGVVFSNNTVQDAINKEPDAKVVGTVFSILSVVFLIIFILVLAVGILQIVAGFRIRQKRNRVFNIVIGILALPSFPLGTALGIFTIIVLSRPAVIEMFQAEQERLALEKYGKIG
jgi:hypothetical protein